MPGRRFHTVDVFAREPDTGTQLAVFHDAADLDDETMLVLTRKTNPTEPSTSASAVASSPFLRVTCSERRIWRWVRG